MTIDKIVIGNDKKEVYTTKELCKIVQEWKEYKGQDGLFPEYNDLLNKYDSCTTELQVYKEQMDEIKLYYKEKIRWIKLVLKNDCHDLQFEHEIYLEDDLIDNLSNYTEILSKLEELGKWYIN